jgi:hypothetical protein
MNGDDVRTEPAKAHWRRPLSMAAFAAALTAALWVGWWLSGRQTPAPEPAAETASQQAIKSGLPEKVQITKADHANGDPRSLESEAERVKYVVAELEKAYDKYLGLRTKLLAAHPEIEQLRQVLDRLPYTPIYDQLGESGKQAFFEFRKTNPEFMKQHYRRVKLKTNANAFLKVTEDPEWREILNDTFDNAGLKESLKNMMAASDEASGYKAGPGKIAVGSYEGVPAYLRARRSTYQRSLAQDAARFQLPSEVTTAMQLESELGLKTTILKMYINSYLKNQELNTAAKDAQRWLSELGTDPRRHPSQRVNDMIEIINMNIDLSL